MPKIIKCHKVFLCTQFKFMSQFTAIYIWIGARTFHQNLKFSKKEGEVIIMQRFTNKRVLFAREKKRHKIAWLAISAFLNHWFLSNCNIIGFRLLCTSSSDKSPPSSDHLELASGTVTETSTLREEELVSMSSLSLSDSLLAPSDSGEEGSGEPDDDSCSSWLPRWFWYSLGSILRM